MPERRRTANAKHFLKMLSDPKEKLSTDDYVPINWSSDLEWIVRIRAAEAAVRQEHGRAKAGERF